MTLLTIERYVPYVPPSRYSQEEVTRHVQARLDGDGAASRLLSVCSAAGVGSRGGLGACGPGFGAEFALLEFAC